MPDYSFNLTAGNFAGSVFGYSNDLIGSPFGSIDGEPIDGTNYLKGMISGSLNAIVFEGDATTLVTGKTVWVDSVEYVFDDADWAYDGGEDHTIGSWDTGGPDFSGGAGPYFVEIKDPLTAGQGVGSASGVGTAAGVARSTAQSAGSAAGVGAASGAGTGGTTSPVPGTAAGTSTALAVGRSTAAAVGVAAGVAVAAAIGARRTALPITDTDALQMPVDYVLAGDLAYSERYRTFEGGPMNVRSKSGGPRRFGVRRLSSAPPSFSVTTTKRGYD